MRPPTKRKKNRCEGKLKKIVRATQRKWDIKQNINVDNEIITTNSLQNAIAVSTACVVSVWEVLECDD